ncbi:mannose-1-phosphate guanyltransferase [Syntrophotalea acetylenica]|jgi:mannose-1-phosphate guanylyltransferase/phosphomannomutase|uniref:Phosphoglucomutase n=1 Tax=Syntrophotalea acetylenica TaxID=29542 RepID=A0A1L3GFX7_SYNAC|nr:mannose-1-phosphate guanyltransferase [Syntrophotalea acetylenica]APG24882.1 phosphoglucomutase [Syntrophotalea acetylenica]APG42946.1 phosphoglucomutase [Syntrophotalea acetylenica]MDY0261296.1 mannose-1-phosphate guanyltransferase [Syntrophotalea acetylenica]
MKAVIMAGGFGTRMQPLTINQPKPMVPLVNQPIMSHIIALLKQHGISDVIMLLFHQPEIIKNYFGDGSELGVRITYVTPLEDFGTAGAVRAAAPYLDERFLVISGDLLTDFDLGEVLKFHEEKQALATITLTSVEDPLQFGVVITDQQGAITKFLEKPGWGEVFSDTINTGIYVFEPAVLDMIPEKTNRDWSKDIFPRMLAEGRPLYGCRQRGYWADIGNTDAYLETCRDLFRDRVAVSLPEPVLCEAGRRIYLGTDTQVAEADLSRLEGMVVIGDNSQVQGGSRLKNCVIGRNCVIEDDVELEDVILWDNVFVKRGCRLFGTVAGHRTRLGRGVVSEEGVVIGDETDVGDEAYLRKDVKIWPRKSIESGSIVSTNLIWGDKWRKSLFEGASVRGLSNVELSPEFCAKLGAAYGSVLPRDSYVITSRDGQRSSRMLKRAFLGGVLSTGVNVRDIKQMPLPVMSYKLGTFGEVGGVHFRQFGEDSAATEILFYDAEGFEIPSGTAKAVERIFFKENFRRVHYAEPGEIRELPQLTAFYREGFLRALDGGLLRSFAPKVVIDLNHSPAGELLPGLLTDLGCEVVELNSRFEEGRSATAPDQTARAMQQLSRIVVSLEAAAGFWLDPSGERVRIIDESGSLLTEIEALGVVVSLVSRCGMAGILALPVSAPMALEKVAQESGLTCRIVKNDARALLEAVSERGGLLAATLDGRFAVPGFQGHFDGMFAVAKILEMLGHAGMSLGSLRRSLPDRAYRQAQIPCSRQFKGGVMRKMSEHTVNLDASFVDGVKIRFEDDWVLVLPDQYRPLMHIVADSPDIRRAESLLENYRNKVETWKKELLNP